MLNCRAFFLRRELDYLEWRTFVGTFIRWRMFTVLTGETMRISRTLIATAFAVFSAGSAQAQDCRGQDRAAGTVLGAAGGAAIGGAVGGDARGAIAGAVLGGVAGNVIAGAQDCQRPGYRGRDGREGASIYLGADFDQDQYWTVDSYADFESDYRRIWRAIERGRESGSLNRYEARQFSERLRRIQERADRQQRRGRFNPVEIQEDLRMLRYEIRATRRDNREERYGDYDRRR